MSNAIQKERIRTTLIDRRNRMTEQEYREKSDAILERLVKQKVFQQAQVIHCYLSMNDRMEPDTHPLVKSLLRQKKMVVVPVVRFRKGILSHVQLTSWKGLSRNRWGVLEPSGGKKVPPQKLDLVVVPMVGGDRMRNRLGYGKGFYDRFLQKVDCPKVGLLFEECYVNELPAEPFDISMDIIVTDGQVV